MNAQLRSAAVALALALAFVPVLQYLKNQTAQPEFSQAGPARLK